VILLVIYYGMALMPMATYSINLHQIAYLLFYFIKV